MGRRKLWDQKWFKWLRADRHDNTSTSDPTSEPWNNISKRCSDETYSSLKPMRPWFVGQAVNGNDGEEFDVTLNTSAIPYPLGIFSLEPASASGFTPLQINYSDPIFFHLDNVTGTWPKKWVVVPENYTSTDWVCRPAVSQTNMLFCHQLGGANID